MHKRWFFALICLLFIAASIPLLSAPSLRQTHAQDTGTALGIPRPGQNALEFIGRIDQTGFSVNAYGYVTNLAGIPSEALFASGTNPFTRDAIAARLTFTVTGAGNSRANYEGIFVNTATGVLTIYYSDTTVGATFDDPASFAQGTPIATYDLNLQTILNVQEPNVGVLYAPIDATQTSATPFTLDGTTYTLGQGNRAYSMTLFGQGFRASEEPLAAHYNFGGHAVLLP